jgi:predicted N-acetyltransferase YhbS
MSVPWQRVELLDGSHDLSSFCCGLDSVDSWFQDKALTANESAQIRTHVCLDDGNQLVAFFALRHVIVNISTESKTTQRLADAAEGQATGILLAQMGVNRAHQGQGTGRQVVTLAMDSALRAHREAAFRLFVVDAENDSLVPYYSNFGFKALSDGRRLIMKMSAVEKIVSALRAPSEP